MPGARTALEPAELGTNAPATAEIGDVFRSVHYGGYATAVANNAAGYLRPGTYVAELDRNPFLASGLTPGSAVKWVTNRCVVVGILGAEAGVGARPTEVQPRPR